MKHPKCKMALEKDNELYANFILQFDISRRHHEQERTLEQERALEHGQTSRQEMGICSSSRCGDSHDHNTDSSHGMEKEKCTTKDSEY
jgi:hypothetical protein